jgi:DNA (cytosine-5)-methyltransferase 1
MTHGSLFSGIGGFDLAAEWMGWENKFHCEWNPFGQKVLKHYWPEAESFNDITKSNFEKYAGTIDIISGGFPCQPYSTAGKRLGKDDARHLWPEMLRVISEVRPRWVVGENVRGLISWNGGMVFDEVQADLEAIGFEVLPFLLPACAVGAVHRRDRIWFIAHAGCINKGREEKPKWASGNIAGHSSEFNPGGTKDATESRIIADAHSNGQHERHSINEINSSERGINAQCDIDSSFVDGVIANAKRDGLEHGDKAGNIRGAKTEAFGKRSEPANVSQANGNDDGYVTDSNSGRLERANKEGRNSEYAKRENGIIEQRFTRTNWKEFPTKSPICDGNDGIPDRLDGITFPKWRKESIKGGGNAICPQVAFQIFKAIEQYEQLKLTI